MTGQASLDGFDPPSAPQDRLFFALMPDAGAAAHAERLAHEIGAQHGAKPHQNAKERFHITLFHVGDFFDWPQHVVDQACGLAASVQASPLTLRMNKLASFSGSPKHLPYVLLCDAHPQLNALQATLQTTMLKGGLVQGKHNRQFTPHLTLLYGHQPLPEQVVEPVEWTARDFVLVHSLIGQGQYRILGRWPLTKPGAQLLPSVLG